MLGYNLPAHAAWVPLPRGDHELAHPQGSVLADTNTLEANFCVEALKKAIHKFGPSEIMFPHQEALSIVPLAHKRHQELWLVYRTGRTEFARVASVQRIIMAAAEGLG
ncbi:hypothetical protein [Falsirhodobacter sp. alg1]|uniref:hypothetical protein n=1 Tax=Falsirhodobacter sp. alg1 TaxID=1472418 RepID=UPI00128F4EF8|nr:hypothetical protein [Falsirhodobacter sp. alg1]